MIRCPNALGGIHRPSPRLSEAHRRSASGAQRLRVAFASLPSRPSLFVGPQPLSMSDGPPDAVRPEAVSQLYGSRPFTHSDSSSTTIQLYYFNQELVQIQESRSLIRLDQQHSNDYYTQHFAKTCTEPLRGAPLPWPPASLPQLRQKPSPPSQMSSLSNGGGPWLSSPTPS
jgi:hypothetical protein